jgi:alpha-beta hydrolase superfamily lysophospholipase
MEESMEQTFSWNDSKGIKISGIEWRSASEPIGVITLVHGLGEHYGRYQHFAEYFNQAGFVIQSFDLPGHGRSEGVRGHFDSYDEVVDEINHLLARSQSQYPGKPNFLYGHSLGGSLVIYYGLHRPNNFKCIFASAPGLSPADPVPGVKLLLANVMDRLLPKLVLENGLDLSGLSRDPQVEIAYRADPLVHGKISARLGKQLLANGAKSLQLHDYPQPLVIMQGSADRLVNPTMNIEWARQLKGDITLKVWEGFFHELHNEPEKEFVFRYVLDQMKERI